MIRLRLSPEERGIRSTEATGAPLARGSWNKVSRSMLTVGNLSKERVCWFVKWFVHKHLTNQWPFIGRMDRFLTFFATSFCRDAYYSLVAAGGSVFRKLYGTMSFRDRHTRHLPP